MKKSEPKRKTVPDESNGSESEECKEDNYEVDGDFDASSTDSDRLINVNQGIAKIGGNYCEVELLSDTLD